MDDDARKRLKRSLDASNHVKKILDEQDRIKKILDPANDIARHIKALEAQKISFLDSINSNAALKAIEDSNSLGRSVASYFAKENLLNDTIARYEERFSLPKFAEAERIAEVIYGDSCRSIQRYGEQLPNIQQAMISMHTPWLDTLHVERSIRGFAEMQTIGYALNAVPSFDTQFTNSLRLDLGDWRDTITWPGPIFTDSVARTDFYVERGLNTELTDFPEHAFHQSLSIAGVMRAPPVLIERYGPPILLINNEGDEEAFARTNSAHDWLQRLETQLRQFIDEVMTKTFGADWAKRRLPNGLYDKWMEKKEAAENRDGRQWPLIAYADFTEYSLVICKKDNWREVFVHFFEREESVRESFQRLHPIRINTMHARPITQDDELLLYIEVKRLAKALRQI